jgi:hypothetical protein
MLYNLIICFSEEELVIILLFCEEKKTHEDWQASFYIVVTVLPQAPWLTRVHRFALWKITVIWNVTLCSVVETYKCFGGTCCHKSG